MGRDDFAVSGAPAKYDALVRGAIAMLVTPFAEDGSVDLEAVSRITALAVRQGAAGIALHGLAGEGAALLDAERSAITAAVAAASQGRPITAGVDHESTYGAIALACAARDAGASSVMAMPPKCTGGNRRRIIEFYAQLEKGAGLPVMVQDAPRASGVRMDVSTLCDIAGALELPAAIKVEDAIPDLKMRQLIDALGERRTSVLIHGGAGGRNFLGELAAGADGTVIGPAYVDFFAALMEVFSSDRAQATRMFRDCLPLLVAVEGNEWYARLQKELLFQAGVIPTTQLRHPVAEADPERVKDLFDLYRELAGQLGFLGKELRFSE